MPFLLLFFVLTGGAVQNVSCRHTSGALIPKRLQVKLCEQSPTLDICRLLVQDKKEAVSLPSGDALWNMCETHPDLVLCQSLKLRNQTAPRPELRPEEEEEEEEEESIQPSTEPMDVESTTPSAETLSTVENI